MNWNTETIALHKVANHWVLIYEMSSNAKCSYNKVHRDKVRESMFIRSMFKVKLHKQNNVGSNFLSKSLGRLGYTGRLSRHIQWCWWVCFLLAHDMRRGQKGKDAVGMFTSIESSSRWTSKFVTDSSARSFLKCEELRDTLRVALSAVSILWFLLVTVNGMGC